MSAGARRPAVVWPLLFLALVAVAYAVTRHRRDLVDFEVYRTAGLRAATAAPLYRPDDGHYQFKYLPAFAVAMVPLGWIPDEVAKALWFAGSAWLIVLFFRRSVHALPERRHASAVLLAWVGVLAAKFWVKELVFGQTNVWLGLLAFAALGAVVLRRPLAAGIWVGVAVFVKPYAVILLPWLWVASGLEAIVAAIVVVAVGFVAPAVVYGFGGNLDLLVAWYRTVTDTTAPNLLLPENISIATMWAKWIGPGVAASGLAAGTSLAMLLAALAPMAWRRRVTQPAYLEMAALLLVVPLLSPQGWDYVLLLGVPAIVILIDRWNADSILWRALVVVSLATVSLSIFDLTGRALYLWLMARSLQTVAAIGLVTAVVHLRRRSLG